MSTTPTTATRQWAYLNSKGLLCPVAAPAESALFAAWDSYLTETAGGPQNKKEKSSPATESSSSSLKIITYQINNVEYKVEANFQTLNFTQYNTKTQASRSLFLFDASWYYLSVTGDWKSVAPNINAELEFARQRWLNGVYPQLLKIWFHKDWYLIDLQELTQQNLKTKKYRPLFRVSCEELAGKKLAAEKNSIQQTSQNAQLVIERALANIVGQENVRSALRRFADSVCYAKLLQQADPTAQADPMAAAHMMLMGPPGTGKNTIAEAMAQILHAIGRLPKSTFVSVTSKDLLAGFVGQSAIKTAAVIERAVGGVLFIDEAYVIADNTHYGPECLTELITQMTMHRDDLVVIIAGYEEKLEKLFAMNAGLKSRFPEKLRLTMQPFTLETLEKILRCKAAQQQYCIDSDVDVQEFILRNSTKALREKENGRLVENLYEGVKERLAARIMEGVRNGVAPPAQASELRRLIKADFF